MPRRLDFDRVLLATLGVFFLSLPLLAIEASWLAAGRNHWIELQHYEWLVLDAAARSLPWKSAGIVAGSFGLLGLGCLLAARSRPRLERAARPLFGFLGHPVTAVLGALLGIGLLPLTARVLRPTPPTQAPNVLVVVVDTWRADHAGFLGYERNVSPGLDALAGQGVVFERAMAQSGWTKPSVATLLTGLLPSRHRAISQPVLHTRVRGTSLPPSVTTMTESFRAAGYETAMWSNNPNIVPVRGFDQGAEHFQDYFHDEDRAADFDPGRAEHMLPDVETWLLAEREEDRPFFAYVHIMDAHYPYVAPPPFRGTFDRSGLSFQLTGQVVEQFLAGDLAVEDVSPEMRQRLVDIYDEELLYVDYYLAPFVERLRDREPNTIVVIVGDHGEEFLEHGQFGHGHTLYEELTHVPMVLLGPHVLPGRVSSQVRLMDVYPTLLDLAGLTDYLPAEVQGESLLPVLSGGETEHRPAPMESGGDQRPPWHWRGITDGRTKVLRREPDLPTELPVPELTPGDADEERPAWQFFDLMADPFEQTNLYEDRRQDAQDLFEILLRNGWYVPPTKIMHLRRARTDGLDEDELDRLRDLGYAGG